MPSKNEAPPTFCPRPSQRAPVRQQKQEKGNENLGSKPLRKHVTPARTRRQGSCPRHQPVLYRCICRDPGTNSVTNSAALTCMPTVVPSVECRGWQRQTWTVGNGAGAQNSDCLKVLRLKILAGRMSRKPEETMHLSLRCFLLQPRACPHQGVSHFVSSVPQPAS